MLLNAADLAGATAFPNIIMPRATESKRKIMSNSIRKPALEEYSEPVPSDYVMIGSFKLNYV